jgi:hypothetical protein
MKCLGCDADFPDGKSLSNHIKKSHGMSGEEYTIKFHHHDVRPLCASCGSLTRYSSFQFKKYCQGCSRIAAREGGAKGGRAESWNKGKTAQTDSRIREISNKVSGSGNPFFGRRHDDVTRARISISKRLGKETIASRIEERDSDFKLLTPLHEYFSRQRQYLELRCKTCGDIQQKTLQAFERGSLCETCHPVTASQWQIEVESWIKDLGIQTRRGDRTVIAPKEIDIFVPEKNLGIECHGLYFHSEAKTGCDPKAHSIKANLADAAGVRLLQIFQDEWQDRQEIVKGMILSRLGLFKYHAGARQCKIVEVDAHTQRQFFERSHLSGYAVAKIAWGLEHKGEIVACMSLRAPRQKKWNEWLEISRFAIAPGWNIPGGLSRISSVAYKYAVESEKQGLMTYVDRRVGKGEGYLKSGFVEVGSTGPDYWYSDLRSRFDRFKFRARDGKSERQIASESRVFRIWGAGSKIFTISR